MGAYDAPTESVHTSSRTRVSPEDLPEYKKDELQGNVTKDGHVIPAGTKVSEVDFSSDEKKRLKDLGIIK
jgi:hypothetical protein